MIGKKQAASRGHLPTQLGLPIGCGDDICHMLRFGRSRPQQHTYSGPVSVCRPAQHIRRRISTKVRTFYRVLLETRFPQDVRVPL
jgi:hypothetical protein